MIDSSQDGQAVVMLPWAVGLDLGLQQPPGCVVLTLDVFTSASSATAGQYFSTAFDPGADGIDAFAQQD